MNNNKKVTNVPNLRFPKFTGEWKDTTLDHVSRQITERVGNKQYALISINSGIGLVSQIEKFGREIAGNSYKNYIVIHKDDFAYNKSSTKTYPEGQIAMLTSIEVGAVPNSIFTCFGVSKEIVYPNFIKYLFETNVHGKWLKRFIAIGARAHGSLNVDNKDLFSLPISFPNLAEQIKIAHILQLLDNRIATQSQIIKELETLMKGLILYFTKGKEPNAQLKDCLTCHASTLMESAVAGKTGEYPVYGAAGVIAHTPDFEIDGNTILIIKDGASVGKVQYATGKYSAIGTLNYLKPKGEASLKYFYYHLQTFNFDKYRVGSGIPHICFKDYGSEHVYCPTIEEQIDIADFLSAINEKITTERRLLHAYTDQKKYMLANMFI